MQSASALSPQVLQYLESIKGAPCFFEKFLQTDDFKRMREFAKDFGGIEIPLPNGKCDLVLNLFGVITLEPCPGTIYAITAKANGEDDETFQMNLKHFLSGVRKHVFPGSDSAWCAAAVVQAVYDSTTKKVNDAIARSVRE
jgi:hypothetical protein